MASKAQKFCKYNNEIKDLVIKNLKFGISHKAISQKYNIETSYINDLYYKTDNGLTSLEVFKI